MKADPTMHDVAERRRLDAAFQEIIGFNHLGSTDERCPRCESDAPRYVRFACFDGRHPFHDSAIPPEVGGRG